MTRREHRVSDDWFVAAVEQVAEAAGQACEAIQASVRALETGRDARLAGGPMVEVVELLIGGGGRVTRLSSADAFREYERAVASMRSRVVRALVDEGGLTLTEVSRRMRISRQAASKLYLKRLPVSHIKIDIEFVRDLATNTANRHVVKAIVSLAQAFGLQTVAEGVEDEDSLAVLCSEKVDYAQGYHLGRPAPTNI